MTKTLLEKAKAHPANNRFNNSPEESQQVEELSVAWVKGEISTTQASVAIGAKGSWLYGLIAVALRRAMKAGRIKII